MSPAVKNNQVPPNDPYADPYGYGDPYGDPASDPYGDEYLDESSLVDPYADEYSGGEEGGESLTVDYARQYLKDLEEMLKTSELTDEEKNAIRTEITQLKGKLNTLLTMSASAQEKVLGQISEQLFELENRILCPEESEGGDGSMKSQIEETRKKAEEYLAQGLIGQTAYDKILEDLSKAEALLDIEGESEEGSPQIQELIDAAQENLISGSTSSEGAQKLGDLTGMDPAEIEGIAEKHGLDLNNLPNPPTKAVMEFALEINPELASKFQAVEDAKTAYNDAVDATKTACTQQNSANTAATSDMDNTDMSNFQKLFDHKYHQSPEAKNLTTAMQEANGLAVDMLKALYPEQADSIKIPDPSTASGWEGQHQNYLQADKIIFGGSEIDMFNSSNGKLHFGAPDTEPEIEMPTIMYDWEGDGDWEDHGGKPSVESYGEDVKTKIYDNGGM